MNIKKIAVAAIIATTSFAAHGATALDGVSAETEFLLRTAVQKATDCKTVKQCKDTWGDVSSLTAKMADEMRVHDMKKAYLEGMRDTIKAARKSGAIDKLTESSMLMTVVSMSLKAGVTINIGESK